MNLHQYKQWTIEVVDEPTYEVGSADNSFNYSKQIFGVGANDYPTSKHGIKIFQDEQEINNCIIIGSGGSTGINQNSSLLDKDQLVICCCDTVFCLTITNLSLKWKTKADQATCFKIFQHENDYIIHGELQITKLNNNGQTMWEFGGADIFVSLDNNEAFKLENDGILLTDFGKTKYKIDFNGKLLWDTYKK